MDDICPECCAVLDGGFCEECGEALSQWDRYSCETSEPERQWAERANAPGFAWGRFIKRYYLSLDKVHVLSVQASPMLEAWIPPSFPKIIDEQLTGWRFRL